MCVVIISLSIKPKWKILQKKLKTKIVIFYMKFSNCYFYVKYFLNSILKLRFDYRNINWKFDIKIKS